MSRFLQWMGVITLGFGLCIGSASAKPSPATSTSEQIGVVDLQALLDKSPQMASFKKNLQKTFTPRREQLAKQQDALKAEVQNYQKNASVLYKDKLSKLRASIQDKRQALQQAKMSFSRDLMTAQEQGMKSVLSSVRNAVQKVATKNHYDLVIIKNNAMYVASARDLTSQVAHLLR